MFAVSRIAGWGGSQARGSAAAPGGMIVVGVLFFFN
jgi:hypothetical protein